MARGTAAGTDWNSQRITGKFRPLFPTDGTVGIGDNWSDGFDAVEILNSGDYDEYFPYYLDLVPRGMEPTPTGTSDSHGWWGEGESVTFLHAGVDDPTQLTGDLLIAAMKAHATVASRGPWIDATIDGAWAPGLTVTGTPTLTLKVWAPSWMVVDAVDVYRDGQLADTVVLGPYEDGDDAQRLSTDIVLDPALTGEDADAAYVFVARGASPMSPVYPGLTPWAAAAAIRVDIDGDGWTPPLPSLVVQ